MAVLTGLAPAAQFANRRDRLAFFTIAILGRGGFSTSSCAGVTCRGCVARPVLPGGKSRVSFTPDGGLLFLESVSAGAGGTRFTLHNIGQLQSLAGFDGKLIGIQIDRFAADRKGICHPGDQCRESKATIVVGQLISAVVFIGKAINERDIFPHFQFLVTGSYNTLGRNDESSTGTLLGVRPAFRVYKSGYGLAARLQTDNERFGIGRFAGISTVVPSSFSASRK